jgi:hypothetical protein
VLQAFIDDSYDDGGVFVLAGYVATPDAWAAFSKEWEEMLPFGVRDARGFHFKMSEMAANAERMARVPGFFRIIERHALMGLSCAYNTADLAWARRRMWSPRVRIDWGMLENRYLFASRALLDMFHTHKAEVTRIIPLEAKVDFIFDQQTEQREIHDAWDRYIAGRPKGLNERYGAIPRFEDDREFLPLQAADFWAWWVRKWYRDGTPEKIGLDDFGAWRVRRRPFPRYHIQLKREHIVENFRALLRDQLGPQAWVYVDESPAQ